MNKFICPDCKCETWSSSKTARTKLCDACAHERSRKANRQWKEAHKSDEEKDITRAWKVVDDPHPYGFDQGVQFSALDVSYMLRYGSLETGTTIASSLGTYTVAGNKLVSDGGVLRVSMEHGLPRLVQVTNT